MRTIDTIWRASGLVMWMMAGVLSACGGQNGSHGAAKEGQDQPVQTSGSEPLMLFDTLEHDFGTIIEGERVVCYFDYENGGDKDLIITSVEATCGCTTPG